MDEAEVSMLVNRLEVLFYDTDPTYLIRTCVIIQYTYQDMLIYVYRGPGKSMRILLSNSQAGPGRKVKQEQEEISRNHVQAF